MQPARWRARLMPAFAAQAKGSARRWPGAVGTAAPAEAGRDLLLMVRRTFIASLALAILAVARGTTAQPSRKVYRIGILSLGRTSDMVGPQPRAPSTAAFLRGLRELGYVYGEHFATEPRGGEGRPERYPSVTAELARLQVDVIVAAGPMLPALKQATSTIPVVMAGADDAVSEGFARSLAHPGANFTGFNLQGVELSGKRLELLKELVPRAAPVAVLWSQGGILNWRAAEAAARERGWKLLSLEIRDEGDIEGAFKAATSARVGALLIGASGPLYPHAGRITELATKSRLPAMYPWRAFVEVGGLISYGPDINDIWRRAAVFVDKILKGAKPADLPIEQPTKFELVINLKAAKSLRLAIPHPILSRADDVIQ
jgi:putative ABC transport system substrate-binding protein